MNRHFYPIAASSYFSSAATWIVVWAIEKLPILKISYGVPFMAILAFVIAYFGSRKILSGNTKSSKEVEIRVYVFSVSVSVILSLIVVFVFHSSLSVPL